MILSILSITFAFLIAFGRQIAVFGRVKHALWFFSHFEIKRLIFSILSLSIGFLAIYTNDYSNSIFVIEMFTVLFVLFSFLFDMKYFFPEVNKVEKSKPFDVNPQLQIIGVKIGNISIAYPLNEVVVPRHIINDKINDNHILISYCALCQSALAFKSELDNHNYYFKVAGVWRRNMIIYDTETYSLWQQATGECIYGNLKGKQLELLSGENTTFGEWQKHKPETLFATKCIEARKGYVSRELMLKMINKVTPKILVPGFADLTGLAVRETVFGITFNGVSRAYPISEVENLNFFTDMFNDKKVSLKYNKLSKYLTAIDVETEKQIIIEKHWWLGWKEFHPETEIWKKTENKL